MPVYPHFPESVGSFFHFAIALVTNRAISRHPAGNGQIPSANDQQMTRNESPRDCTGTAVGNWDLELDWSLALGPWGFAPTVGSFLQMASDPGKTGCFRRFPGISGHRWGIGEDRSFKIPFLEHPGTLPNVVEQATTRRAQGSRHRSCPP
jgi:hypothetical protein